MAAARPAKLPVGTLKRFDAAASMDPQEMPEQTWCNTDGTTFDTRVGPGYSSNKRKEPSKQCIYECVAIDLFSTDAKISHVARLMELPGDKLDDSGNDGYLPRTFVVNCQIPNYACENAIWGVCAGDGVGYSLVFYFCLSAYGREVVARRGRLISAADSEDSDLYGTLDGSSHSTPRHSKPGSRRGSNSGNSQAAAAAAAAASAGSSSSATPSPPYEKDNPACFTSHAEPSDAAVRLLHNFTLSEEGSELRQRFKAMTRLVNLDSAGLGGATKRIVTMYNGTPFLIRTCSVFWRGDTYFEVDVDVHRFSYAARVGLNGVKERIKDVVFDFGFVIEGHSDFELPENMLGAVRLSKLDLSLAKPFKG